MMWCSFLLVAVVTLCATAQNATSVNATVPTEFNIDTAKLALVWNGGLKNVTVFGRDGECHQCVPYPLASLWGAEPRIVYVTVNTSHGTYISSSIDAEEVWWPFGDRGVYECRVDDLGVLPASLFFFFSLYFCIKKIWKGFRSYGSVQHLAAAGGRRARVCRCCDFVCHRICVRCAEIGRARREEESSRGCASAGERGCRALVERGAVRHSSLWPAAVQHRHVSRHVSGGDGVCQLYGPNKELLLLFCFFADRCYFF